MKTSFLIILVALIIIAIKILSPSSTSPSTKSQPISPTIETQLSAAPDEQKIIAEGLETPWSLVFLPDKSILVSERPGRIRRIDPEGKLVAKPIANISQAKEYGEGGLMGIEAHPDFDKNHYLYLYYTYTGTNSNTLNRVTRMTYENNQLTNEKILIDAIPGSLYHNGGRIKFGPDKYLYVATGDAQDPSQAQNLSSNAGKILRVTDEGKPAPGNPFNTLIYSYGHRNIQGLAWDPQGQLWATEHGVSAPISGYDEINRIEPGKNYGWPTIQGSQTRAQMVKPVFNSETDTWAPAGAIFIGNSLYFAGLRSETLFEAVLKNNEVTQLKKHLTKSLGRIRDVVKGPDGMLYITTSNRDGRGTPHSGDDKVIRINPNSLREK